MFKFVVSPYLSVLFGVPEARIANLEVVCNPKDTREARVFLKLEESGPVLEPRYTKSHLDFPWEILKEVNEEGGVDDDSTFKDKTPEEIEEIEEMAEDAFIPMYNKHRLSLTMDAPSVDMKERWDYKWDSTQKNREKAYLVCRLFSAGC